MKTTLHYPLRIPPFTLLALAFSLLPSAFCLLASAQGTAFTYQGRLSDGTSFANGTNYFTLTPPTGHWFFRLKKP